MERKEALCPTEQPCYSHPISVSKKMHGHMDVSMVSILSIVSILSKKNANRTWDGYMHRAGRVNLDAIVTNHFGLNETAQALEAGRRDPRTIKAIV